jgi:hypothetical protein
MKALFVTLFTLLTATSLMATKKTAVANGNWTTGSIWSLSNAPADGDSLIIPAGDTVSVSGNNSLNNVVIIVYGVLDLSNNGKLTLDALSMVYIQNGAKLLGNGASDQLKIGSGIKWKGTDGPVVGPQYADNSTSGFDPYTVLAVSFQSFYVTRQGTNIQLSWSTSAEVNNAYYAIEKSTDSRTWKQIAQVTGAGTANVVNNYDYTDKNSTNADVYYRIREIGSNGANFYSAIRALHNGNNSVTNIFASANKKITIDFNSDVKDNVSIQLINMSGQVIVRKEFSQASYRLIVDAMSAGSGVYAVRVSDSKGWSEVKKIAL